MAGEGASWERRARPPACCGAVLSPNPQHPRAGRGPVPPGADRLPGGRLDCGSPPPGAQPCKSALASPGITKYLCLKWRRKWPGALWPRWILVDEDHSASIGRLSSSEQETRLGGSEFPVCAFPSFKCEPRALRVLGRLERGSCGLRFPAGPEASAEMFPPGLGLPRSALRSGSLHCADPEIPHPTSVLNVLLLLLLVLFFSLAFSLFSTQGAERAERSLAGRGPRRHGRGG